MIYKLTKLDDTIKRFDILPKSKHHKKNDNKEYTVNDLVNYLLDGSAAQLSDYEYSDSDMNAVIVENLSHELLVTIMNNLQYIIILNKFSQVEPSNFKNNKYYEWEKTAKLCLDLCFVFYPNLYEGKLEKFEKEFPYIDFETNGTKNAYWQSFQDRIKYFQDKYNVDKNYIDSFTKEYYEELKKMQSEDDKGFFNDDTMDNIPYMNLDIKDLNFDDEVLDFIKHKKIDIKCSGKDWQIDNVLLQVAKEINKRDLSCAVTWNIKNLSHVVFKEYSVSKRVMRQLYDLEPVIALGINIKEDKDVYKTYYDFALKEINSKVELFERNKFTINIPFNKKDVEVLETNLIITLHIANIWKEPIFVEKVKEILDGIENYENILMKLNRKTSPFSTFNEDEIVRVSQNLMEKSKDPQLVNLYQNIINGFNSKQNDEVDDILFKNIKSQNVEININNIIAYQEKNFNKKITSFEINKEFNKRWSYLIKSFYPEKTNFEAKINNGNISFIVYEHPDMKMTDEKFNEWVKNIVNALFKQDLKEKVNESFLDSEFQKILMNTVKEDVTNQSKRVKKF